MVQYPWVQPAMDRVVLQLVFIEKNPCISGPMQFKPVLFKGQLYTILWKVQDLIVFQFTKLLPFVIQIIL